MAASQLGLVARPALINGAAGWISLLDGDVYAIAALTLQNGRIATMDILLDPHASLALTSRSSTPNHDGIRRPRPCSTFSKRHANSDRPSVTFLRRAGSLE
jgi:hypothetical protein